VTNIGINRPKTEDWNLETRRRSHPTYWASISIAAPSDQSQTRGDGHGSVDDPRRLTGHETPWGERDPQPLEYPDCADQRNEGPSDDSRASHRTSVFDGAGSGDVVT